MKLLTPNKIFNETVYKIPQGETLLDVALKFSVTPQFLILDNFLTSPPKPFELLLIKNRGEIFVLTLEILEKLSQKERDMLRVKNKVEYLFVGQILLK